MLYTFLKFNFMRQITDSFNMQPNKMKKHRMLKVKMGIMYSSRGQDRPSMA